MTKFQNKYRVESTRLPGWDYGSPGLYFITICKKNMVDWFGEIIVLDEEWQKTRQIREYVKLYEWVVMPNHFHAILGINDNVGTTEIRVEKHCDASLRKNRFGPQTNNLASIIRGFKGACTKRIRKTNNPNFAWQARFWDHIVRNEKSFERITEYILLNPKNWDRDKNNRRFNMDSVRNLY
ncbi:MAG: transposase [Candidatus Marinimicrobia bacterium]|nr:transposase [Candidatus Neomarinimicrobiota bacterium]